jgi:hypothetical protein
VVFAETERHLWASNTLYLLLSRFNCPCCGTGFFREVTPNYSSLASPGAPKWPERISRTVVSNTFKILFPLHISTPCSVYVYISNRLSHRIAMNAGMAIHFMVLFPNPASVGA